MGLTSSIDCNLVDILKKIRTSPRFSIFGQEIEKHFWEMFVIDAFIGNTDRNNGNWGLIKRFNGNLEIAPIFDNGNCLNNKMNSDKMEIILKDENKLKDFSYISPTCVFTHTKKDEERRINPFQLITKREYPLLNEALIKLVPLISKQFKNIKNLIDKIPLTSENIEVITTIQKTYFKSLLNLRLNDVLIPSYNKLVSIY